MKIPFELKYSLASVANISITMTMYGAAFSFPLIMFPNYILMNIIYLIVLTWLFSLHVLVNVVPKVLHIEGAVKVVEVMRRVRDLVAKTDDLELQNDLKILLNELGDNDHAS